MNPQDIIRVVAATTAKLGAEKAKLVVQAGITQVAEDLYAEGVAYEVTLAGYMFTVREAVERDEREIAVEAVADMAQYVAKLHEQGTVSNDIAITFATLGAVVYGWAEAK